MNRARRFNSRMRLAALVLAVLALVHAWTALAVVAAVAGMVWLIRLRLWPRGPCWWCLGRRGRNAGSEEMQWGDCTHCNRTGERLRFGAALINPKLRRK